jgi:hypothetical protein
MKRRLSINMHAPLLQAGDIVERRLAFGIDAQQSVICEFRLAAVALGEGRRAEAQGRSSAPGR